MDFVWTFSLRLCSVLVATSMRLLPHLKQWIFVVIFKHSIALNRLFISILFILMGFCLSAAEYRGRVVDAEGVPVPYATVYLENDPIVGTATNNDGYFLLTTDKRPAEKLIISFIGYEKLTLTLADFALRPNGVIPFVRLKEQPVALEETVVTAKASKQKNKRKQMAQLLYKVYNRMQYDFPDSPTQYKLVSDVRMNSEQVPWGMEQMIATVVNIPDGRKDGRDSVQFCGEYCKRFFQQTIRDRADSVLAGTRLNKDIRKMANEVDSGVVVHYGLWAIGNIKYDFEHTMDDLRHWSVSNESETETVLTHVESKNYLGIFKYEYKRHYIVDSDTYRVRRFSEELTMALNVPFGYKFKQADLELLNLLNMGESDIKKFRLKKANATVTLNTIYQLRNGKLYPQEKNLRTKAKMVGTKDKVIPVDVRATQRVTQLTPSASPLPASKLTKRVSRKIVEIY